MTHGEFRPIGKLHPLPVDPEMVDLRRSNAALNVRLAIFRECLLNLCDLVEDALPPFETSEVVYTRELLNQYRTMCQ